MSNGRLLTFTLLPFTLVAFAANSILCRLALRQQAIGPLEFTLVRLVSGMLMLLPILLLYRGNELTSEHDARSTALAVRRSNITPALALFGYALFFSLAYTQLDAAIGVLILFPSVQMTMLGGSIYQGNRLTAIEWTGFTIAFGGLIYLLLPGITAPPLSGAILMMLSGISWGLYSLMGKREAYPILSTARNFLFCLPAVLLLLIVIVARTNGGSYTLSAHGFFLAALSGGVASALGYVLWYITLRRITTTLASIAQLAVPVIAGMGGVIFLNETVSLRLVSATVIIIGGIIVTIMGRRRTPYPAVEVD